MSGDTDEEIKYFVLYRAVKKIPGTITIDTSLMTGGSSGNIVYTVTPVRPYSPTPLFSPIPYEFLSVGSDIPTLSLSVNSIEASCSNSCGYQINVDLAPLSTSAVLEGATLTTGISSSTARRLLLDLSGLTLSDVTVSLLGVSCIGLTGSIDSFSCTFPTNSDGSVALPAGTDYYKMHV